MPGIKTRAHGHVTGRTTARTSARQRRHLRVRKRVSGSASRPRLAVSRSARNVFAQLIDDVTGTTLAAASTLDETIRAADGDKTAKARQAGALLAERARALLSDALAPALMLPLGLALHGLGWVPTFAGAAVLTAGLALVAGLAIRDRPDRAAVTDEPAPEPEPSARA